MSKRKIWTDRLGNEFDVTNIDEFQQEGGTMSKTGAWALDHQEKEQEEYKTYRVTEKQVMEKTWIIKAKSPTDAWNSHINTEPDNVEEGMRLDDGIVEVA